MSEQTSNQIELTVSDLAASLKRTIETNYDHVVVRGELGRVTVARSGHMYADVKDDKAVLNTVMWKTNVERLPFKPEEGLEVIASGKLSIYAGRSNYQLIASSMRPAGAGALMQLLAERKKKFAAEGLFAQDHKKPLPFLPQTIGVVTSPTGAVIRDILHRVRDRFPVRVILWPALVQGDSAAAQIEAGIRGFNAMTGDDRPDVLIVGRGGGSIEDLWPFNEENVVRAAFECDIPLISAVGHEVDNTLIDFVSDARAPTPTGAAEIAVPVRSELLMQIEEFGTRLKRSLARKSQHSKDRLSAAKLPKPEFMLQPKRQRFDLAAQGLTTGLRRATDVKKIALTQISARLRPDAMYQQARRSRKQLIDVAVRARPALNRSLKQAKDRLAAKGQLLETLSYQSTLRRGYAIVKDDTGKLVRSAARANDLDAFSVQFSDGDITASPNGDTINKAAATKKPPSVSKSDQSTDQGDLF